MISLNTIKKAFDQTFDDVTTGTSKGIRSCNYFVNSGYVYKDTKRKKTSYTEFIPMWLPSSLMEVINGKEISKWSFIVNSEPNENAITNRVYNNDFIEVITRESFLDELNEHITKTISENCNNNPSIEIDFINRLCKALTDNIKNDTNGKYLRDDPRLVLPSDKLENYITIFDSEHWCTEEIIKQLSVLSMIALFPSNISKENKTKLTEKAEDSVPKEFKARLYYRNRAQYRNFRNEEYQLALDILSKKPIGNNHIVVVTAPGGEGKTALASYIYYYFKNSKEVNYYQNIKWLDFSTTLEDAILKCNDRSANTGLSCKSIDAVSLFSDEFNNLESGKRILLIIDNLNKDRGLSSDPRININELLNNPNIDFLITTRLGKEWKNNNDWRKQVSTDSWIELKPVNINVAKSIFHFYYGVEADYCSVKEKEAIDNLLDLTSNNILAIQLLASGSKHYKHGLIEYYKIIRKSGFKFPNQYLYTEHNANDETTAYEQINNLYSIDLDELDDSVKNLIWYFALPESGIWFSENDINSFFFEDNIGNRRHINRCIDAETLSSRGWLLYDPQKGYTIHDIIRVSFLNQLNNIDPEQTETSYKLSGLMCTRIAPEGVYSDFVRLIVKEYFDKRNDLSFSELRTRVIICIACLKYTKLTNIDSIILSHYVFQNNKTFNASKHISFFKDLVQIINKFIVLNLTKLDCMTIDICDELLTDLLLFLADYSYCRNSTEWLNSSNYYDSAICSIVSSTSYQLRHYQDEKHIDVLLEKTTDKYILNRLEELNKRLEENSYNYQELACYFLYILKTYPITSSTVKKLRISEEDDEDVKLSLTNFLTYHNQIRQETDYLKYDAVFGHFHNIREYFLTMWSCSSEYRTKLILSLINYGHTTFLTDPENSKNTILEYLFSVLFFIQCSISCENGQHSAKHIDARYINSLQCLIGICNSIILSIQLYMNFDSHSTIQTFDKIHEYEKIIQKMDQVDSNLRDNALILIKMYSAEFWISNSDYSEGEKVLSEFYYELLNKYVNKIDDYYFFALKIHCRVALIRCNTSNNEKQLKEEIASILEEIEASNYKNDFVDDIKVIKESLSFPRHFPLVGTIYHYSSIETQEHFLKNFA